MRTLPIQTGLSITLDNKSSILGCYYPEDDWSMTGIGTTFEEALVKVIEGVEEKGGIALAASHFTRVEFVEYEGSRVIIKRIETLSPDQGKAFERTMLESEAWAASERRLQERRNQQELANQQAAALEKEKRDKEEYERLKEKFTA